MAEKNTNQSQLQKSPSANSDESIDKNMVLLQQEAGFSSNPDLPDLSLHISSMEESEQSRTPPWYRSIKFKLFMITNLLIFTSIGFLSVQNSTSFRGVLKRQSQENLVNSALLLKSSLEQNLKYWLNISKMTLQSNGVGDLENLRASFQNILASETAIVGISIYKLSSENMLEILRVDRNKITDGDEKTNPGEEKKNNDKNQEQTPYEAPTMVAKSLFSISKLGKQSYFGSNLTNPRAPLIYIGTRFVERILNQSSIENNYWAVLTLKADAVSGLLSKNETISQFIVDHQLKLALAANNQSQNFSFLKLNLESIRNVIQGKSKYVLSTSAKSKDIPVMSVATGISSFDLVAITQRKSNLDQLQINYQIRNFLLLSWIVLLVSIAVTYLFANEITKSLSNVVKATVEISKGKFGERVKKIPSDEVGLLAHAINRMAADIGSLMGVREQAIRQQSELKMAEEVQKTMIPESSSVINHVETASFFKSATECAGDWWGRFSLSDSKELVVISDVTGHGAHSALVAALAYGYFSTFEKNSASSETLEAGPEALLRGLNRILFKAGDGSLTMSAIAIIIDHKKFTATISNAGHCAPELVQGSKSQAIIASGDIVGLGEDFNAQEVEIELKKNEIIFTYTDGLFECTGKNGKPIMKKKLRNLLSKTLQDVLEAEASTVDGLDILNKSPIQKVNLAVRDLIQDHFNGHALSDDITLLFTTIKQARFDK
jgi:serine phosphatase RsbU (regulator of sigma subunit)